MGDFTQETIGRNGGLNNRTEESTNIQQLFWRLNIFLQWFWHQRMIGELEESLKPTTWINTINTKAINISYIHENLYNIYILSIHLWDMIGWTSPNDSQQPCPEGRSFLQILPWDLCGVPSAGHGRRRHPNISWLTAGWRPMAREKEMGPF